MDRERDDVTAIVSPRGARRWAGGHPWIFRSDVQEPPDAPAGYVRVRDPRGAPLGTALWSPRSEIALRLVDRDIGARLDTGWWTDSIARAVHRRRALEDVTNAMRLVHGEGDGLPSLVVDRYADIVVVQFMSAGVDAFLAEIVDAIRRVCQPAGILARNDAALRAREGLPRETRVLFGDVPREVEVVEYGLRYLAAPWTGQKTGAFLDQRESRDLVGSVARGRQRALDCFSYHGSFALHLARAAEHVTALDVSEAALARAAENAGLNALRNVEFVAGDAFEFLRASERSGDRFDMIVLDPPAFAKNRAALPAALRGYKEINLRAMRVLAPGGLLYTASCSFHVGRADFLAMLRAAAADSGRRMVLREQTGQPLDHPELLTIPETGYLKGALLEAES